MNSSPARIVRESIETPATRATGSSPRPRPSTQSVSHLCNRPPHKFLKEFALTQDTARDRSVFTVLRAPPYVRVNYGLRPSASSTLLIKRARCQTLGRSRRPVVSRVGAAPAAPIRDRQIPACGRRESDSSRDLCRPATRCLPRALHPWPGRWLFRGPAQSDICRAFFAGPQRYR